MACNYFCIPRKGDTANNALHIGGQRVGRISYSKFKMSQSDINKLKKKTCFRSYLQ